MCCPIEKGILLYFILLTHVHKMSPFASFFLFTNRTPQEFVVDPFAQHLEEVHIYLCVLCDYCPTHKYRGVRVSVSGFHTQYSIEKI